MLGLLLQQISTHGPDAVTHGTVVLLVGFLYALLRTLEHLVRWRWRDRGPRVEVAERQLTPIVATQRDIALALERIGQGQERLLDRLDHGFERVEDRLEDVRTIVRPRFRDGESD